MPEFSITFLIRLKWKYADEIERELNVNPVQDMEANVSVLKSASWLSGYNVVHYPTPTYPH